MSRSPVRVSRPEVRVEARCEVRVEGESSKPWRWSLWVTVVKVTITVLVTLLVLRLVGISRLLRRWLRALSLLRILLSVLHRPSSRLP